MANQETVCPVCGGPCPLLDVVDFNKSCEEARGTFLGLSGVPVYYVRCSNCGFCFAPEFSAWTLEEFEEKIYNDEYALVDPDYSQARPRENAAYLNSILGDRARALKHLDYGGGSGVLAQVLRDANWQSTSYDPFVDRSVGVEQIGRFELITAFEVFEHVPDVNQLMSSLRTLLAPDGVVIFTTFLSDGNIEPQQRLNWWYASPRNGHISLYSSKSLEILAGQYGLNFGSFTKNNHIFFSTVPPWADQIIPTV